MSNDMEAARAKVACPECGREIGRNNLKRHRATHGVASNGKVPKARAKAALSTMKRSRIVGRYLDQLDLMSEQRANGQRRHKGVPLGALPGFASHSMDPDEIDRAADVIEASAQDATAVKALRMLQRVIELREAAANLRETGGVDVLEQDFIAVAGEWAAENGISYAAFRAMGVSAAVLRDAGIMP